jgi:hypothetical protein
MSLNNLEIYPRNEFIIRFATDFREFRKTSRNFYFLERMRTDFNENYGIFCIKGKIK